ncbi:MAG: hypothetical protein HZB38_08775, partial [Planctomycetes bacterium]|nr:hypothetical protein [Planctomycetota bacterium]
MRFPHRTTGQPSADSTLYFEYYSDGSVASRTAPPGTRFRYQYDESARLVQVLVDYSPPADVCPPPPEFTPVDRISRIAFSYDDEGKLLTATAHAIVNGVETLLTDNAYGYDGFDNLLFEQQSLRAAVSSGTPRIDYAWSFASAYNGGGNFDRLDNMTYPQRLSSGVRRVIDLQYGDAGGANAAIDEALNRVARIVDTSSGGGSARYGYAGTSRRASLTLGAALIAQSFANGPQPPSAAGLPGLDAFGRTKDLHYTSPAGVPGTPGIPAGGTIHQYEYNYDLSGNRTHARVVQQPAIFWTGESPVPPGTPATPHDNDRSYLYGYDELQRLISADLGALDEGGPGVPPGMGNPSRAVDWSLDNLGNWTGIEGGTGVPPDDQPGLTIVQAPPPTAPPGTPATVTTIDHAVNRDNSLESITRGSAGVPPATAAYVVNAAGNTVFDGAYFYQYDAWNRLVEVREKGTLTAGDFDPQGRYIQCPPPNGQPPNYGVPGPWVARYVYDGLGRLVRKTTPVVAGQTEPDDALRFEDYRYDGVRRIQEIVTRQEAVVIIPGGAGQPGGEGGTGVPPVSGAGGVGGIEPPLEAQPLDPIAPGATLVVALPAGWDQREYVWGPDYVDDLAWQIAGDGTTGAGVLYYSLLDANYNVMALVAGGPIAPPSGAAAGTPTLPAGTVVEQYVWSPYGELLSRDVLDLRIDSSNGGTPSATYGQLLTDAGAARPPSGNDPGSPGTAGAALVGTRNKVGHQGLFFERFDGLNTDPPLVPTDATAVTASAPGGRGKGLYYNRWRWYDAVAGRFVSEDMNGAGLAGSQSLAYHGYPLDVSVESYAAMTQYGDGMSLFAYLSSSPLLGTDALGLEGWWDEDIDEAIADRTGHALAALATLNEGARWASIGLQTTLDIAAGFLPGSGLYDAFKSVQVIADGKGGFWDAVNIAMAAMPIVKGVMGLRSLAKAGGWGRKMCNSFAAGTLVDTPNGPVPIEQLRPGDWVVSRHEADHGGMLVVRRVTETIVGLAEQVLWVT